MKFLIHLLGDIHHPLHVEAVARGGNDIPVCFGGLTLSLHFAWDVSIPQAITGSNESNERATAEIWADKLFHNSLHTSEGQPLDTAPLQTPLEPLNVGSLHGFAETAAVVWAPRNESLGMQPCAQRGHRRSARQRAFRVLPRQQ